MRLALCGRPSRTEVACQVRHLSMQFAERLRGRGIGRLIFPAKPQRVQPVRHACERIGEPPSHDQEHHRNRQQDLDGRVHHRLTHRPRDARINARRVDRKRQTSCHTTIAVQRDRIYEEPGVIDAQKLPCCSVGLRGLRSGAGLDGERRTAARRT